MKKLFAVFLLLVTTLTLFAVAALAQSLPVVPEMDPITQVAALVMNWKTMGPLGLGMAGIVLAMGILKRFVGDFKWKRLVVTILACGYGTLLALSQGAGLVPTLVAILITGGGAVAIYEAIKGLKQAAGIAPPSGS